jgi:hypothetical protein
MSSSGEAKDTQASGAKPRRAARVREEWRAADTLPPSKTSWPKEAAARFVHLLREERPAARSFSR